MRIDFITIDIKPSIHKVIANLPNHSYNQESSNHNLIRFNQLLKFRGHTYSYDHQHAESKANKPSAPPSTTTTMLTTACAKYVSNSSTKPNDTATSMTPLADASKNRS